MSDILIFHILGHVPEVCVGTALFGLDSACLVMPVPSAMAQDSSMPYMCCTKLMEETSTALGHFWWEASGRHTDFAVFGWPLRSEKARCE